MLLDHQFIVAAQQQIKTDEFQPTLLVKYTHFFFTERQRNLLQKTYYSVSIG